MRHEGFDILRVDGGRPVKMWTRGVPVEHEAMQQLANAAKLPFIFHHIAAMPDVHVGKGSTIGSVIPTRGAIIPAAVGVDIGCGMMAAKTTLTANDLPDNLGPLRNAIEKTIPCGMSPKSQSCKGRDQGTWHDPPLTVQRAWAQLEDEFDEICRKTPQLRHTNNYRHLGTLGSGNHFIEVCLDEANFVWYVQQERHFGRDILVTRKGAVSAKQGELGIIPGSMGAKSYIVRGKGHPESFHSCSHGAGRVMSRSDAKRRFTILDQRAATAGVECRKDVGVIDEIPMAYKNIDAVMAAQHDLVEVVHTLKQVVCVKG
jgi:RNA-splicing ligase RtcB